MPQTNLDQMICVQAFLPSLVVLVSVKKMVGQSPVSRVEVVYHYLVLVEVILENLRRM